MFILANPGTPKPFLQPKALLGRFAMLPPKAITFLAHCRLTL
jgi:hypothetical protein